LTVLSSVFFFFQAEDGIRDFHVTGVQTCALPIYNPSGCIAKEQDTIKTLALLIPINLKWMKNWGGAFTKNQIQKAKYGKLSETRSEERRVGKECRCRLMT